MVRSIAQAYREAYGGLSKEVWILSLALLINRSGSMVYAFLTLYLTEKLGFSMLDAGTMFSIFGAGSLVGVYLGGRLVKPLGAIRTQICGLLLAPPILLLVPLFDEFWKIGAVIFFYSMCTSSVRPANSVAVSQFTEPELMTRAFGLQRMAVNLGFSIGPAIGGFLAMYNFTWLFFADALTTALGGAVLIISFGFRKYAKTEAAAQMQKAAEQTDEAGSPLSDHRFLIFLGMLLLSSLVFMQYCATYPKYLQDFYSMSKFEIGLMFSVNTVLIVVLEMLVVNKVKALPQLRTIGWGCFLSCFGFALLPLGNTMWFCVISVCVFTIGEMLNSPLSSGFVANRSINRDRGMYMSAYSMTYSLAAIIAPPMGTYLYQINPHLLWGVAYVIGAVVLIGFYRFASLEEFSSGSSVNESLR